MLACYLAGVRRGGVCRHERSLTFRTPLCSKDGLRLFRSRTSMTEGDYCQAIFGARSLARPGSSPKKAGLSPVPDCRCGGQRELPPRPVRAAELALWDMV